VRQKKRGRLFWPSLSIKNVEIADTNRVVADRLLAQAIHSTPYKNHSLSDQ
jgi:hypothetical protein